jgi:hypothetical protein
VVDRLRSEVADNVDAALYQLMAFEVCHRLGLQPEYEPSMGRRPRTCGSALVAGHSPPRRFGVLVH